MYRVKPHSSPSFLAAFDAAIVHRNHFFRLYQQNKSSVSKGKFIKASNLCKRVLEAVKLTYANKTKEFISSQKLLLGLLANCQYSTKVILPIPHLFNGPDVLSSASDKAKLFAEKCS